MLPAQDSRQRTYRSVMRDAGHDLLVTAGHTQGTPCLQEHLQELG